MARSVACPRNDSARHPHPKWIQIVLKTGTGGARSRASRRLPIDHNSKPRQEQHYIQTRADRRLDVRFDHPVPGWFGVCAWGLADGPLVTVRRTQPDPRAIGPIPLPGRISPGSGVFQFQLLRAGNGHAEQFAVCSSLAANCRSRLDFAPHKRAPRASIGNAQLHEASFNSYLRLGLLLHCEQLFR